MATYLASTVSDLEGPTTAEAEPLTEQDLFGGPDTSPAPTPAPQPAITPLVLDPPVAAATVATSVGNLSLAATATGPSSAAGSTASTGDLGRTMTLGPVEADNGRAGIIAYAAPSSTAATFDDGGYAGTEVLTDEEIFGNPGVTTTGLQPGSATPGVALGPPSAVNAQAGLTATPDPVVLVAAWGAPTAQQASTSTPTSITTTTAQGPPTAAAAAGASTPTGIATTVATAPPATGATGAVTPAGISTTVVTAAPAATTTQAASPGPVTTTIGTALPTASTTQPLGPDPITSPITTGAPAAARTDAVTAGSTADSGQPGQPSVQQVLAVTPAPASVTVRLDPLTAAHLAAASTTGTAIATGTDTPTVMVVTILAVAPDSATTGATLGQPALADTTMVSAGPGPLLPAAWGAPAATTSSTTAPSPVPVTPALGAPAATMSTPVAPQPVPVTVSWAAPAAAAQSAVTAGSVTAPAGLGDPSVPVFTVTASNLTAGPVRIDVDQPIAAVIEVDGAWTGNQREPISLGEPVAGLDRDTAPAGTAVAVSAGGTGTVAFTGPAVRPDSTSLPLAHGVPVGDFTQNPVEAAGGANTAVGVGQPSATVVQYLYATDVGLSAALTTAAGPPAAVFEPQPVSLGELAIAASIGDTPAIGSTAGAIAGASTTAAITLGAPSARFASGSTTTGPGVTPDPIVVPCRTVAQPLVTYSALGTARWTIVRQTDRKFQLTEPF